MTPEEVERLGTKPSQGEIERLAADCRRVRRQIAAFWDLEYEDLQPIDYGNFLAIRNTHFIVGARDARGVWTHVSLFGEEEDMKDYPRIEP